MDGREAMSGPSAPLPPRQRGTAPPGAMPRSEAAARMLTTVIVFIVGLSVLLSIDWASGTFRNDAAITILSGVLVASIIYVAARLGSARARYSPAGSRLCPTCGRSIPPDSLVCAYCGQRLR